MPYLQLKPSYKAVKTYYQDIKQKHQLSYLHEGAVAPHFARLLEYCAGKVDWTLIEQYPLERKNRHPLRADGALLDKFNLVRGIWEAKDSADDLSAEVQKKFKQGYPGDNILFQAPSEAILYQNKELVQIADLSDPDNLVDILQTFFAYEPPAIAEWERAVEEFKDKVPQLAESVLKLIQTERKRNPRFITAFADFSELVKQAINPNISDKALEEMLIQHLLVERLLRTVFSNPDFSNRNIIAVELEKVIQALTSRHFSRHEFLGQLDRFYGAIERAAATMTDFSQKQTFLNTVYENFFQGFSVKVADTHGIVYTPQAIVDFMVQSVDDLLQQEFGLALHQPGVHILDPFVGTGNFILRIMRHIGQRHKTSLRHKYLHELHCNEVMLLPYYIASMSIEHDYFELTGDYQPFSGICLVDTFELAEAVQPSFFVKENTQRVKAQQETPIFVVIGNPPYNVGQINENDNNQNRSYPQMDKRVSETYAADSTATNKNALSDPYVKAFRWAADRLKKHSDEGIVAFVTNNGFLNGIAFDGMRKHLAKDFSKIYHINLKGNARTGGERRRQEAGNVFDDQIRVSVGITFLIRQKSEAEQADNEACEIYIAHVDDYLKARAKQAYLEEAESYQGLTWQKVEPNKRHTWLTEGLQADYEDFLPLGTKAAKAGKADAIFENYGRGVATSRDAWAYNFQADALSENIQGMIEVYNEHVHRYAGMTKKPDINEFVSNDDTKISWSATLKQAVKSGVRVEFEVSKIRPSVYRPYIKEHLYFDHHLNERRYQFPSILPTKNSENKVICVSGVGSSKKFQTLMVDLIPCLDMLDKTQCFPFYTYDEDGENQRENISDWALAQFQRAYDDDSISKWDIFYYIYGLLHHPDYAATYQANLRRQLPRIPFVEDFASFAEAGRQLAEWHINYESQPEYPLAMIETPDEQLDWRVETMRFAKNKTQLKYNQFLTLGNIPPQVFEYRLGIRSALEWLVDRYRVTKDKRSGLINDPNRLDDPEYIVRLIKQVTTVSLNTVELVASLPPLNIKTVN